jgi:hypothetical protein
MLRSLKIVLLATDGSVFVITQIKICFHGRNMDISTRKEKLNIIYASQQRSPPLWFLDSQVECGQLAPLNETYPSTLHCREVGGIRKLPVLDEAFAPQYISGVSASA